MLSRFGGKDMVSIRQAEFLDGFFPSGTHRMVHDAPRPKMFCEFPKRGVKALSIDFEGSLSRFFTERLEALSFLGLHVNSIAFHFEQHQICGKVVNM
jgi:hypothetical protein